MLPWLQRLKQEWILPEIHPERCVHSQCEIASCTRCVDVCPKTAWLLNDSGLMLDTSRCDGCGLCVAACTETALTQELELLTGELDSVKTILVACEYTDSKLTNTGIIPCIYLISHSLLNDYYGLGFQQLLFACGDCESCPRKQPAAFAKRLDQFNLLLASRAAPLLQYQHLSPQVWVKQRSQLHVQSNHEPAQTRRQFLRQAMSLAVEKSLEANNVDSEANKKIKPWPSYLPTKDELKDRLYPFVVQLDPMHCNACNACVKLCPHQALNLNKTGKTQAYEVSPEQCTGCNLCVDSCDQEAIELKTSSTQPEPVILTSARCQACGNPFHYPAIQAKQTHCRICSKTNHSRQLFQVYS